MEPKDPKAQDSQVDFNGYKRDAMIDYDQYRRDAIRTEKPLDAIVTDGPALLAALKIAVACARFMDLVKKGVIYGKEVQVDDLTAKVKGIEDAVDEFDTALFRDVPDDYEGEAMPVNPRLLHAGIGLFGEAGEVVDALLAQAEGGTLDSVNLVGEIGDLNWYQALALDELRMPLSEVLAKNIAKLKARHGDKFSLETSENRDLDAERAALEG